MRKEYDLKKFKRVSPDRVYADPKVMISVRFDLSVLNQVREEAERMGIPYQTLIQSVIHRFVSGELIDKKEAKKISG
ncbi:MAG: CopG family antitoxin [Bacteriovoracaceae bacterium]